MKNTSTSSAKRVDYMAKILVIGDSGVGKTCLILRYCEDKFTYNHLTTIGVDFKVKNIDFEDKRAKLQIWDTAGQERFKTITASFYRGASGIILTYACNDRASFTNVEGWMKQIKEYAGADVCKILVGNKSDATDRVISYKEGQKLAEANDMKFFETSAKDNINVSEAFEEISQAVLELAKSKTSLNDEPEGIPLRNVNVEATISGCIAKTCK